MFSHIVLGVGDFDRAFTFYSAVLDSLGIELRFCERDKPWAGWHSADRTRPLFVIRQPLDGLPHAPGNGQMVAFSAASREVVRQAHRLALSLGGRCEGPPGLRPQYHPTYYGAYFRDPDGNKVCVVCHAAEVDPV